MFALKHSVKLKDLKPQIVIAAMVAYSVYSDAGIPFIITSANDSRHKSNSIHYKCNAIDVRTRNIPIDISPQFIANQIRANLTDEFDVVLEADHIHIEYDPK